MKREDRKERAGEKIRKERGAHSLDSHVLEGANKLSYSDAVVFQKVF